MRKQQGYRRKTFVVAGVLNGLVAATNEETVVTVIPDVAHVTPTGERMYESVN